MVIKLYGYENNEECEVHEVCEIIDSRIDF